MSNKEGKAETESAAPQAISKLWKHPATKVAVVGLGAYALLFASRFVFDAMGKAAVSYNRMKEAMQG